MREWKMGDKELLYTNIDEYIAQFEPEIQAKLNVFRERIREFAPDAAEKISWSMPTFYLHGNLVHFAAHKKHIGFYPGVSGVERFKALNPDYTCSKGGVQFPYDKEVPFDVINEVVQMRVAENIRDHEAKTAKKQK